MSQTLSQLPVGSLVVDPNTKYYNSPIVWMKLEDNHDGQGTTTLLTEKIVSLKAFDAKEPNNSNSSRKNGGNNRYAYSNLINWLNSEKQDWYKEKHGQDQSPESSTYVTCNAYSSQAGFLNGFSYGFKKILKSVGKVTAKNTVTDSGGSETVYSKIFLLSETEVGLGNENNIAEGTQYSYFSSDNARKCQCTAEAIANSDYTSNPTVNDYFYWWLRTPSASTSNSIHYVISVGALSGDAASSGGNGVRPACVIPNTTTVSDEPDADGYYTLQLDSAPQTVADLPIGAVVRDPDTKYYNSAINWKIIGKNHDGNNTVTLLTEDILCFKAFDAKEPNNTTGNRSVYGNNRYKLSNILQWLNSSASEGNWYIAQHQYDTPPTSDYVYAQNTVPVNPYESEAGFLNGFSANMAGILEETSRVTALSNVDGGGSETVTSKIFLLSYTEVGLANENSIAEGTLYEFFTDNLSRIVYATQLCIDNINDLVEKSNLTTDTAEYWRMRTPLFVATTNYQSGCYNRIVGRDGDVNFTNSNRGDWDGGIRPAAVITSDTKVNPTPDLDGVYTIQFNSAPTLTLSSTNLSSIYQFPSNFTYTVNDADNNLSSLTISLDGTLHTTVDLSSITLNTPTSFSLTSEEFDALSNSSHTLTFTATDTEGETTTVTCTFTKFVRPTKDRIMNHDDALKIITGLNHIIANFPKKVVVPTLTTSSFSTGSSVDITDYIEGFNSTDMIMTGDITASEDGVYFTEILLRNMRNAWEDGIAGSKVLMWKVGSDLSSVSWANATDDMLVKLVKMSDNGDIDLVNDCGWAVGDTRNVSLSAVNEGESHVAQEVTFVITAVDTGSQDSSNPCWNYQFVEKHGVRQWPKVIIQQLNCLSNGTSNETVVMNINSTNVGSWFSSYRRLWCNKSYMDSIPDSFRGLIKLVKVKTAETYNGTTIKESEDYVFLPSAKEIIDASTNSNTTEASSLSVWGYYSTSSNRIKKIGNSGSATSWWTRSPYVSNATAFCSIGNNGAIASTSAGSYTSVAPAACI